MIHWNHNNIPENGTNSIKISVVLAVYNKPKELEYCLEGYRRQSLILKHPDLVQIVLADDGSGPEIEKIFTKFSTQVKAMTTYIRQEHNGWGKPRMLNRAVQASLGERIVFTDGDCIPHIHFLKAHLEDSYESTVSCGRRVDLMQEISKELKLEDIQSAKLESIFRLIKHIIKKETDFGEQGFYIPKWIASLVPFFSKNSSPTIVGSNFGVHKSQLLKVNGFDETFNVPGLGEDTDIERRFLLSGLKLKWINYRAIQYHIWHPLTQVGEDAKKIYESLKEKGNIQALKGLKEIDSIPHPKTLQLHF